MKLNSTERAALLQVLANENNHEISLQKGFFHKEPTLTIRFVNQKVECVKTVFVNQSDT